MQVNFQKGFAILPLLIIVGLAIIGTGGYFGVTKYNSFQANLIDKEKEYRELALAQQEEIALTKQAIEQLKAKTLDEATKEKTVQVISQVPKPKTLVTPSGAVIDELGNLIKAPEEKITPSVVASNKTELSNEQISKLAIPAVVRIKTPFSKGSGFVIGGNYILTAAHVVQGVDLAVVDLSTGNSYEVSVVGRDEINDLALLKISISGLPSLELGDSDKLTIGEGVLVYGHSLGLPGVVMSVGILNGRQPDTHFAWLQTDAKTQGGNSGGPWLNRRGEVIGIHNWSRAINVGGLKINEGFNFAIPINFVKTLLPELKTGLQKIDPTIPTPLPPTGSNIEIPRGIMTRINFNPDLECAELFMPYEQKYLNVCKLYRANQNDYNWVLID